MQAVTISDQKIKVGNHPDPKPGTGEVLVAVRASGLNGADIMQLRGLYPAPPGWPQDIPGLELAGEVVEVGSQALRFQPGDRVMGLVGGGGQAEFANVHERCLMPVPESLDWPAAGAMAEVFCTAHDALFTQAGLASGERLLVHGAAGGVGTAAVQLGRSAGATVIATVRDEASRQAVADMGAFAVEPDSFDAQGPFDVILELVGAPNLEANIQALQTAGRIVVIGVGAGAKAELNMRALMQKRGRILASTIRSRPLEDKAHIMRQVEKHVLPLFDSGQLVVPVNAEFSLQDAAEAYERFQAGRKFGKLVLVTG
jgi:NADPH:quinone reductase